VLLTREEIHCKTLCAVCYRFDQFVFQKQCYCNAVTPITDLICALFGPHAAMFVNRIYPGKSLKTSFLGPGKPVCVFELHFNSCNVEHHVFIQSIAIFI